jgi:hypothetical protein
MCSNSNDFYGNNCHCHDCFCQMNGTARFKKCKQWFEYQSYLETSGGQSSNQYLNAVHFFNTIVNKTSVAA